MTESSEPVFFLKSVIEAVMFVSNEPLDISQIEEITAATPSLIYHALAILEEECRKDERGISLQQVDEGYKMVTKQELCSVLEQYFEVNKKLRVSRALLEVLAIIAYKAPITRAEIEDIRGVDASSHLVRLQELEMIKVVGQKEVPGRPYLYSTTDKFLQHFNLTSLSDLPPMEEIRQLFSENDTSE